MPGELRLPVRIEIGWVETPAEAQVCALCGYQCWLKAYKADVLINGLQKLDKPGEGVFLCGSCGEEMAV